jgi:hypothetical protein
MDKAARGAFFLCFPRQCYAMQFWRGEHNKSGEMQATIEIHIYIYMPLTFRLKVSSEGQFCPT